MSETREVSRTTFNNVVAMHESNSRTHLEQVESILNAFGVTVAPESTNAEKLAETLHEYMGHDRGQFGSSTSPERIAYFLDANGVKAGN